MIVTKGGIVSLGLVLGAIVASLALDREDFAYYLLAVLVGVGMPTPLRKKDHS